jgi:uncharacterized RDD family membrane protein YckC
MECPFCYTNFEYRLSVCTHCGKSTDDPLYQELFSRVKPRQIEETAPPVEVHQHIEPMPAVEANAVLAGEEREKPAVTTEIRSKNTCNTLVDFPAKKAELPEWRLELQSRLKEIQGQRSQAAGAGASSGAIMSTRHAVGGTGLVMALLEEPIATAHPPLIEKALKRIEESRQKYEPAEPAKNYAAPQAAPQPAPYQAASYTPAKPDLRPAPSYRPAPTPITQAEVEAIEAELDNGTRPFIFSENETVESRLSQIGQNHRENLARAAEIKNELVGGQKFDTNRLRNFNHTISYADEAGTATASVKFRTETAAPKMMPPREEIREEVRSEEMAPEINFVETTETEAEELAPFAFRFNAGLFDFIISGFLSLLILSPFVMLGGNWFTVAGAFAFLVTCSIVMFFYITTAVGLIGRTLGMGLFSLEMIDAVDNDYPTFNQAAVSSSVYLVSLALGGIGFATIFLNDEKRAVHDLLSGTMVVREN